MEEKMKIPLQNDINTLNVVNEENYLGLLSQDDHYVVYSLLLLTLSVGSSVLGLCCVLQYFVRSLVLQSSRWG